VHLEIKQGGGGGWKLIPNIAPIPVIIPIKSILASIKGVIFDAFFEASEGKREASEEHQTPSRVSQPPRPARACLCSPEKSGKKPACYVG